MIAQNLRFRRCQRVRGRADFRRIFKRRCSVADECFVLYVDQSATDRARLGIRAGKRLGTAVLRNRARRQVKEAFRLGQHELPALDMIVVIRSLNLDVVDSRRRLQRLAQSAERKLQRRLKTPHD